MKTKVGSYLLFLFSPSIVFQLFVALILFQKYGPRGRSICPQRIQCGTLRCIIVGRSVLDMSGLSFAEEE